MYGALICTTMSVLRGDDTTHVSFEASFVVLYVLRLDYAYISLSISLVEEGREKSFNVRSICRIQTRRLLMREQSVARRLMKKLRQNRRVPGVETTAITATNSGQTRLVVLFA